jgi:Asp-tRNA(Asn)/Glu-tRNA(Gln) amidotransferase A subunit family amidase
LSFIIRLGEVKERENRAAEGRLWIMRRDRLDVGANELLAASLAECAQRVRTRQLSPLELTRASLDAIGADGSNAFINVTSDLALAEARAAESEIAAGRYRGPLHGIPVAVKDLIDVAGVATTAASRVFANRVAEKDAEVVRRLRAAGAVIVGKTNLHEFAYGGSGVISAYGAVRNPRHPARIAGGSSSGSAAAVAGNLCFAALGTDTAGSIRLPAAYCGIVGFKPSYGLVSARGVVPLAESYDHVGPMARTAADAETVLRAIADLPPPEEVGVRQVRVGVARAYFCSGLEPAVAESFDAALRRLEDICGPLREVSIPIAEDRTVHRYEAWRYHREFVARLPELYDPETLRRIRSGENVGAEEYEKKRRELEAMRRAADALFREVDVIVTPTTPVAPPALAELAADAAGLRARELLMLRNTRPFNVLGTPAISLPLAGGAGLQLAAAPGRDALLLRFAAALPLL